MQKIANSIINIFSHARKYGWKKTFEDWKYNFIMLETEEQTFKKQIIGYAGSMLGTVLAIIILISKGFWYVTIAAGFMVLIQYSNLKQVLKQKQILMDIKNKYNDLEVNQ